MLAFLFHYSHNPKRRSLVACVTPAEPHSMLTDRQKDVIMDMVDNPAVFAKHLMNIQLKPFHLEWIDMFENNDRSAIYAPRGFGKSFTLGSLFISWKVRFSEMNGGPWKFAIISDSLPQSSNITGQVQHTLEFNPYFRDLVPPKASSLVFREQKMELTDGSVIYCRPYSKTAVGIHVDYFLFDEASKVSDTDLYFNDLSAIVNNRDGNIMLIGTPDRPNDLIAQCMAKENYVSRVYVAEKNGIPLWEEFFPMERLKQIKANEGLVAYSRNYLCKLVAAGTQVFPPQELAKMASTEYNLVASALPNLMYFTGIDLAMSPQGDYMIVMTIAFDRKKNLMWIVDVRKTRGTDYDMQLDVVTDVYKTYKPLKILVDDSIYGVPFVKDLIHKKYVPAEPYSFAPASRIELLNNLVRNSNRLIIPHNPKHPETVRLMDELMFEMGGLQYGQTPRGMRTYETGTPHDDMLMGLGLAVYAATAYDTYESDFGVDSLQKKDINLNDSLVMDIGGLDMFDDDLGSMEEIL